jgi:hypothetical protein
VSPRDGPVHENLFLGIRRPADALAGWREAAKARCEASYKEQLVSLLEQMNKVCASVRMDTERRACEGGLAGIRRGPHSPPTRQRPGLTAHGVDRVARRLDEIGRRAGPEDPVLLWYRHRKPFTR